MSQQIRKINEENVPQEKDNTYIYIDQMRIGQIKKG